MTAVSVASASTHAIDSSQEISHVDAKVEDIKTACKHRDIRRLIDLASSEGGLLTDELRRTAWPLLLGCNLSETGEIVGTTSSSWKELDPHPEEEQVQKDVDRAFVYYPAGQSALSLRTKKVHLLHLIQQVLRTNRALHYFQGYHDIAQVLLLVLDSDPTTAAPLLSHLSLLRIRDYHLSTLAPATLHLNLILPILRLIDPPLATRLTNITPFFALSAVLTLFAHDLTEYNPTTRLFDFLLSQPPVIALYLFAALLTTRRVEFLDIPLDEPDILLYTLSKLPPNLQLQDLIARSLEIYALHPPETLGRAWRQISPDSVLKTCRTIIASPQQEANTPARVSADQSIVQARTHLSRQISQLTREEWRRETLARYTRWWHHSSLRRWSRGRTTAQGRTWIGVSAVVIAFVAVYFGSRGDIERRVLVSSSSGSSASWMDIFR